MGWMRGALRRGLGALAVGALFHAAPGLAASMRAAPPVVASLARPEAWHGVLRTSGRLVVHAPPGAEALAEELAVSGAEALDRVGRATGLDPGGSIQVFVLDDQAAFDRDQPGPPPRWADATAWPSHGWIFLRAPHLRGPDPAPIAQVLTHELVHIVVGRAFAPAAAPRWLQEGLAQSFAGERDLAPRPAREDTPSLAAVTANFAGDPHAADAAYVAAADWVRWLEGRLGPQGFGEVLRAVAGGRTLSGALLDATGEGLPALEAAWRASLPVGAWWRQVQLDTAAWSLAAAVVAGRALVRRRRGHGAGYRRYAEEERALAALAVAVLAARGRTAPV